MIMSVKQKKSKFKPRIRLNHNKYTVVDLWVLYIWPNKKYLSFVEFLIVLIQVYW